MKKIPSLFVRDYENEIIPIPDLPTGQKARGFNVNKGRFLATREVTPGCEWVINGEGIGTKKWDGTAVLVQNHNWYKRYDAKNGKNPPAGFIPAQDPDPITGHWPGWVQISADNPADKWIMEAFDNTAKLIGSWPEDGTYEAIGPKIGGNKEGAMIHQLKKHGDVLFDVAFRDKRTYDDISNLLSNLAMEGIVFHHPDGRMCKVKRTDFGLKW